MIESGLGHQQTQSPKLSALIVVHNEEAQLAECLDLLRFADEIVVVLDKCTDASKAIAERYTDRLIEGAWTIEGERRNTGLAACTGDWILEIDADERVVPDLAAEIRTVIKTSGFDRHEIPFDNYIGKRLVRYGWGGGFGVSARPALFRRGTKRWGHDRVHPKLFWTTEAKGPKLATPVIHYVDRDISEMIQRLDRYSSARAQDLRDQGGTGGTTGKNLSRFLSRFYKCFVLRKGYREGGMGLLVAICAGLYPLLSHFKAKYDGHEQ